APEAARSGGRGLRRQGLQELRRPPHTRGLFEGKGERDELRLTESEPHEGDVHRQPEREASRHADQRESAACRRRRAGGDEVATRDEMSRAGWAACGGNDRVERVLTEQCGEGRAGATPAARQSRLVSWIAE